MEESIILPEHKKLHDEIMSRFRKTKHFYFGNVDETFFTLQVYRVSKRILKYVDADKELVLVSALCHDIGKTLLNEDLINEKSDREEWKKHPILGVEPTEEILSELGYDKEFIAKVCYIVKNHDKRIDFNDEKSVELQIVQDADLLADGGIAGYIRPFLYASKYKLSTNQTVEYILKYGGRAEEFDMLNLEYSKKIGKEVKEDENILRNMLLKLTK